MVRNGKFVKVGNESNGVYVKERKKGVKYVMFLSAKVIKPPYYAKLLLTHGHWIKNTMPRPNHSHWIKPIQPT